MSWVDDLAKGNSDNAAEIAGEALGKLWAKKDAIILEQLGDLVRDGLLEVWETQPVLVAMPGEQSKFEMRSAVKLKFKGQNVIDDLKSKLASSVSAARIELLTALRDTATSSMFYCNDHDLQGSKERWDFMRKYIMQVLDEEIEKKC